MATTRIRPRALLRASGGPRYAVALAVDALGTSLLRPLLLLYGVTVLRLPARVTGPAMTAGVVAGLVCVPTVGRWLDRGARRHRPASAPSRSRGSSMPDPCEVNRLRRVIEGDWRKG